MFHNEKLHNRATDIDSGACGAVARRACQGREWARTATEEDFGPPTQRLQATPSPRMSVSSMEVLKQPAFSKYNYHSQANSNSGPYEHGRAAIRFGKNEGGHATTREENSYSRGRNSREKYEPSVLILSLMCD
ncbi:hypothetical protein Y032_0266g726 [Ancylostoma ceylanicum]|uniref:Uncharacterized protein n=1 Tax=Ancylostoma ceylanicum TaxID=53326 RepID=A0A016SA75_9BILA|nr:hypothetical protein Y032_0266g726 [Ancylostoma ceylanicum]